MYFESKRGGGGEVQGLKKTEDCAIVQFKDPKGNDILTNIWHVYEWVGVQTQDQKVLISINIMYV